LKVHSCSLNIQIVSSEAVSISTAGSSVQGVDRLDTPKKRVMIRSVEDLQAVISTERMKFCFKVKRIFKMLRISDKKKELSNVEWKHVSSFRYHTMCAVSPRCIFVHGGENFKSRQNKSATSLICLAENQDSAWHQVLQSLSNGIKGIKSQKKREVFKRWLFLADY
jgi:hypothetical protein